MKKKFKTYILVLFITVGLFSNIKIVYGADSYTLSNDGTKKSAEEIYKDSGLPSSFKDVSYYDCQIPYKLLPNDIGGWATAVTGNSNYHGMTDDVKSGTYMGGYVNYEGDMSFTFGGTESYDDETGCKIITDKNGVKYYVTAIQGYFYNSSNAGSDGFGAFSYSEKVGSGGNRGQLFDIILTDGTVIHFLVGDANSNYHTNGGKDGKTVDSGKDGVWSFSALKLPQYKNLYSAQSANQLEIWGKSDCASKFESKFNLGKGSDTNKIAYYRIYNKYINAPPIVSNDACKESSYKLSVMGTNTTGNATSGVSFANLGKFAESAFVSNNCLTETDLKMPTVDDLSDDQLKGVVDWKNNIDYENDDGYIRYLRIFVMLVGIVFLVWIVLIYLSYWFDRINNFIDIDLLPMITFGRLRVAPEEHECTFNPKDFARGQAMTVNHKVVISLCLTGLFFAVLVISGQFYTLLNTLVRKMLSLLGAI